MELLKDIFSWAYDRHRSVLNWYIRPLFILPLAYFAHLRRERRVILVVVLLALAAAPGRPGTVDAAAPALRVEPASGPCDGTFVARGRGFAPGEEVEVAVRPAGVPGSAPTSAFRARVDASGEFAAAIPPDFVSCLPASTAGAARRHEVGATGRGGGAMATFAAVPAPHRCFAETDFCVAGRFLQYWQASGGLARNGYPLSDLFVERLEDGRAYTVQYFERVRLEAHEGNVPPYDVQIGHFGRRIRPADPPAARLPGATYYAQTGHNLGDRAGFRAYWERNGGLDQFGYPISEEFEERLEDGKMYRVQYFERARFEYHPACRGTPSEVLLGQFGRRILAETTGRSRARGDTARTTGWVLPHGRRPGG